MLAGLSMWAALEEISLADETRHSSRHRMAWPSDALCVLTHLRGFSSRLSPFYTLSLIPQVALIFGTKSCRMQRLVRCASRGLLGQCHLWCTPGKASLEFKPAFISWSLHYLHSSGCAVQEGPFCSKPRTIADPGHCTHAHVQDFLALEPA